MSARFAGKVVLVAGGTGGLGRAVSLAFHQEGAQVIVTYRTQQEFAALLQAMPARDSLVAGPRIEGPDVKGPEVKEPDVKEPGIEGYAVDVTDEPAVSRLVERVVAQYGALDVLVNTVGGYAGGVKLWELETTILDRMLALNLRSGYMLSRAAVPSMLKQGRGAIVNVAAKAALEPSGGATAYAASKAAAVALLGSMAAELKGSGVRVNSILPSIIDTPPNRQAMPHADFTKWPTPEQIARVILFLCSDDAKVIHGAAIPVYGDS